MNKNGNQRNDDKPYDRAELSVGQPPQSTCLATQLLMTVLFLLVVSEVVCQKAMALLKCELSRCALCDIFRFQQTCCSCLCRDFESAGMTQLNPLFWSALPYFPHCCSQRNLLLEDPPLPQNLFGTSAPFLSKAMLVE